MAIRYHKEVVPNYDRNAFQPETKVVNVPTSTISFGGTTYVRKGGFEPKYHDEFSTIVTGGFNRASKNDGKVDPKEFAQIEKELVETFPTLIGRPSYLDRASSRGYATQARSVAHQDHQGLKDLYGIAANTQDGKINTGGQKWVIDQFLTKLDYERTQVKTR